MQSVISYSQADVTEGQADVFSTEPERRSIELAFVGRVMERAQQSAARLLIPGTRRVTADFSGAFDEDYARMQRPVFKHIARTAEQILPDEVAFRRFGEKR